MVHKFGVAAEDFNRLGWDVVFYYLNICNHSFSITIFKVHDFVFDESGVQPRFDKFTD